MDDAGFRQLLIEQLDAVFRLACYLTRSRQDADDCVQDTYVRALRSAHSFTPGVLGIRPWLFKILHNVIHTRGAKSTREQEVIHDHATSMAAVQSNAIERDDSTIDWEDVDERLKAAIAELAVPYRAAFLLSAVEGLKYREIAEVTEVPVGTVMSRLSRARQALAARLADVAAEHGLGQASKREVNERNSIEESSAPQSFPES